MRNKGAQAMMFTVTSQIQQRFPDAQITLLSTVDLLDDCEEKDFRFDIFSWKLIRRIKLFTPAKHLFRRYAKMDENKKLIERVQTADLVIDISGFGLSSKFKLRTSLGYLFNLYLFKHESIDHVLMPQSFGPFDYRVGIKSWIKYLIKRLMKNPRIIFAREEEGVNFLVNVGITRSINRFPDIVLTSASYALENIFAEGKMPQLKEVNVTSASVAIVPNIKLFDVFSRDELLQVYEELVTQLLDFGKTVYLIPHAEDDEQFCQILFSFFPENNRVILIGSNLNAIELEKTLGKMDFIIASRYHCIVHAYKQGVPAVVLGWATKYDSLTEMTSQSNYFIDLRHGLMKEVLMKMVANLNLLHESESLTIKTALLKYDNQEIFDTVFAPYE